MLLQTFPSFINLFPVNSFYDKVIFYQKWSCRQEPPRSMRNLNFAHKSLKSFSGYLLIFINLLPEHSFHEKVIFCQKWSCRREPPLNKWNSDFAHKALKCFSGYVLPLSFYSQITSYMRKSNFCINGVADRNPLFCAECCFGMQLCFWHAALLNCTIVHYLAPPWPQFCLQNLSNH